MQNRLSAMVISTKRVEMPREAWALPLKAVFKGVGQADPDAPRRD
jgi:hypothetical protein